MDRVEVDDERKARAEARRHPSLDFRFNEPPAHLTITRALAKLSERKISLARPAQEICKLLTSPPEADWMNIRGDCILKASLGLSSSLLASLLGLAETGGFAALVLSSHPGVKGALATRVAEKGREAQGIIEEAHREGEDFWRIMKGRFDEQRNIFLFLSAEAMCTKYGLDLSGHFLSPLKLAEWQAGYDPHYPNLVSRAAGTRFSFAARALHGTLRLVRQAIAQDSICSALAQEYQFVFAAEAQHLQSIRAEAEHELGIEVAVSDSGFVQRAGELEEAKLREFLRTNPLIYAMRAVVERDYGKGILTDKERATTDVASLGDFAYQLAMLMVDPAVSEPLTLFPVEAERALFMPLEIPFRHLYHRNQVYLMLRRSAAARQRAEWA